VAMLEGALETARQDTATAKRAAGEASAAQERIQALTAQLAQLESALAREREQKPAPAAAPSAELVAERDRLRTEAAAMKRKLVAAETAIEAAASLKAKVARLEAQLKGAR
jgi:DNA repair exonuclease SbcCD ATPase subunit